MSLNKASKVDAKAKRALISQKRLNAEKERLCEFYRERCIQLELRMVQERVRDLPRAAKDRTKYTGNELIERDVLIDKLLGELAQCNADLKLLKQTGTIHSTGDDGFYGTRFASQLEFGPTSTYK